VNSILSFAPIFGETEEELREDASRDLDGTDISTGVQTLEVVIDGVAVEDPFSYRASSPDGGFVFTIDDGTILNHPEVFGLPAGDYEPAIVDGYWIMLRPLPTGEHTIQWASSGQFQDGSAYDYSATWNITVGK
jgi:hypothetical protein